MAKKKKPSKKVNPAGSNKMIWAVAAGLSIVFLAYFLFLGRSAPKGEPAGEVKKTLSYLENTKGITGVDWKGEEKQVWVIYDSTNEHVDPERIAHFASVRLSARVDDFDLLISPTPGGPAEYTVKVRGGRIESEGK